MSAVMQPEMNPSEPQGTALLPSLMSPGSNLLTEIDRLTRVEQQVIHSLDAQEEEGVLDTRRRAKLLGRSAWRIEVACDAQIVARATQSQAKRGRGNRDVANRGVIATITKRAKLLGCTPNTILKNAQIFRLMDETENSSIENGILHSLDEKGFWVAALSAVDSASALIQFAKLKQTLPRFRVSDAFRYLEREGLTKKIVTLRAIQNARESIPELVTRKEEIQHVLDTISHIKNEIIPKCTSDSIVRIHEGYIEELGDFLRYDLFDADAAAAISKAWYGGHRREDQMSKATGFPADLVHREMGLLAALDEYIKVSGSGTSQLWHKVGEPLPEELRQRG